jgi:hypothetical protein
VAQAKIPTSEPASFVACAGDPVGTWRIKAADYSAVTYRGFGGSSCAADVNDPVLPRMLFKLLADGKGDVFFGALSAPSTVLLSCLRGTSTSDLSCSGFSGCDGLACGVCECGREGEPSGFFPFIAGWEVHGGTLQLSGGGAPLASYDYCVADNQLTLRPQGGEVLYQLERVTLTGTAPRPCAERTADQCVVSTAHIDPTRNPESKDDACQVGACIGDNPACATAKAQTDCTVPGCSWDMTKCSGEPAERCLFGDYDVIPGCDVIPVAAP